MQQLAYQVRFHVGPRTVFEADAATQGSAMAAAPGAHYDHVVVEGQPHVEPADHHGVHCHYHGQVAVLAAWTAVLHLAWSDLLGGAGLL